MKTLIRKLEMGVLLTGLVMLYSCDGQDTLGSATLGIKVIYNNIPAVVLKATEYSEHKIADYLKSAPEPKNTKGVTDKKVEKKKNRNPKIKSISIGGGRVARLV